MYLRYLPASCERQQRIIGRALQNVETRVHEAGEKLATGEIREHRLFGVLWVYDYLARAPGILPWKRMFDAKIAKAEGNSCWEFLLVELMCTTEVMSKMSRDMVCFVFHLGRYVRSHRKTSMVRSLSS